ncbi:hypothetical protein C8J56DRAFT_890875 [Mycena floridula]|nr:hypothetical protein C8J56DRAFT_890875 [Mycena floridula]
MTDNKAGTVEQYSRDLDSGALTKARAKKQTRMEFGYWVEPKGPEEMGNEQKKQPVMTRKSNSFKITGSEWKRKRGVVADGSRWRNQHQGSTKFRDCWDVDPGRQVWGRFDFGLAKAIRIYRGIGVTRKYLGDVKDNHVLAMKPVRGISQQTVTPTTIPERLDTKNPTKLFFLVTSSHLGFYPQQGGRRFIEELKKLYLQWAIRRQLDISWASADDRGWTPELVSSGGRMQRHRSYDSPDWAMPKYRPDRCFPTKSTSQHYQNSEMNLAQYSRNPFNFASKTPSDTAELLQRITAIFILGGLASQVKIHFEVTVHRLRHTGNWSRLCTQDLVTTTYNVTAYYC